MNTNPDSDNSCEETRPKINVEHLIFQQRTSPPGTQVFSGTRYENTDTYWATTDREDKIAQAAGMRSKWRG